MQKLPCVKFFIAVLFFASIFAGYGISFAATAHQKEGQKGEQREGQKIGHFTLENGLEVVVLQDFRSPVVVHMAWYKAGAVDEVTGKTGLAHMLEHMMFKGTQDVPPGEFSKRIAALGGQDNAFTSNDYTAYHQKIARENLSQAVQLEADRATALDISDATFKPEQAVVLEERNTRVDSNPISGFFEKLSRHHFAHHPYGNPVIGWRADIAGLTLADAQNWYKQFYAPQNMLVVFAGALGVDEAEWLAQTYYSPLKNPEVTPLRPKIEAEPAFTAPKRFEHTDARAQLPLWVRLYRAPGLHQGVAGAPAPTAQEVAALSLFADLLGGGLTGALYKALVIEQKLADGASASYSPNKRYESEFEIVVEPKAGINLEELETAVEEVLQTFLATPINAADLERAKIQAKSADVFAQDDLFTAAYRLGAWRAVGGTYAGYQNRLKVLQIVTPQMVQTAGQKVLNLQQSTTGILRPAPQNQPQSSLLAE